MGQAPVALVTGATRGIGLGIAADLVRSHRVLVGGRSPSAVAEVVGRLGAHGGFVADLTDPGAIAQAASGVSSVDVLVHCAGIIPPQEGSARERWQAVFEVNVFAVVQLTELLLPALRAARGHVLLVNSGAGLSAGSDTSGYSASKYALTSYADGLRESERGVVRVTSIHPGRVDTDMQRALQVRAHKPYRGSDHLPVNAVVSAVRAAIDAPAGAVIESLAVRPAGNSAG